MTTEDQILTELRRFILLVLPSVECVQGQENRVPEPTTADYIVMTPTIRKRTSTNVDTWGVAPVAIDISRGTMLTVQLDIHGPNGADNAQILTTLWRDEYGTSNIDPAIFSPLYATDGHQMAFINGERQYEDRWTLDLVMHANIAVSVPSQFADSLLIGLVEADVL